MCIRDSFIIQQPHRAIIIERIERRFQRMETRRFRRQSACLRKSFESRTCAQAAPPHQIAEFCRRRSHRRTIDCNGHFGWLG